MDCVFLKVGITVNFKFIHIWNNAFFVRVPRLFSHKLLMWLKWFFILFFFPQNNWETWCRKIRLFLLIFYASQLNPQPHGFIRKCDCSCASWLHRLSPNLSHPEDFRCTALAQLRQNKLCAPPARWLCLVEVCTEARASFYASILPFIKQIPLVQTPI